MPDGGPRSLKHSETSRPLPHTHCVAPPSLSHITATEAAAERLACLRRSLRSATSHSPSFSVRPASSIRNRNGETGFLNSSGSTHTVRWPPVLLLRHFDPSWNPDNWIKPAYLRLILAMSRTNGARRRHEHKKPLRQRPQLLIKNVDSQIPESLEDYRFWNHVQFPVKLNRFTLHDVGGKLKCFASLQPQHCGPLSQTVDDLP